MPDDIQRELDDLRARHAALEQSAAALQREASGAVRDLMDVIERQRASLDAAVAAAATAAAIRASNSGRLTAAVSRWRHRMRHVGMTWRKRAAIARARRRTLTVPRAVRNAAVGVNVSGYLAAESGMGEAARCSIRALQQAGIPVALNDVPAQQRTADTSFSNFTDEHPHPFNLIHLNADNMDWFADRRGARYFRDRYTIGYWFWELEDFRPDWISAFARVDEVWVATDHARRSIGRDAPVPVVHVPLGVSQPVAGRFGREHFGLPTRPFIFLYTFDVSSQMERKNPMAAIRALKLSGLAADEALLLLKFTNRHADEPAVRRLAEAATGLNVLMIDDVMHRPELNALLNCTDCCLSLHRAEGFGLTIAEHMLLGKPAIATAYSGNLDFMTPDVSRLVPAATVTLTRDYGPYLRGYRWADPDVKQAAAFMRELARAPHAAAELGARGQRHVRCVLDPARTARLMHGRLNQIRDGHVRVNGAAPPVDALEATYA